ncbi:MAG: O-antigen ligase family protein [Bacteroidetes bacterium]|nr:O-antigen ligase family protein [Bacteroidota bacterium]
MIYSLKYIFLLQIVTCSWLIYLTKSRTAIIVFFGGIFLVFYFERKTQIEKYLKKISKFQRFGLCICFTIVVSGIICYLVYFKKTSAIGRILMWKVVISHWKDHFWFGTGLGRFTWYYPQWQADYFLQHHTTCDFFLAAGESYIIFNEYLQLFKEIGFIGFIFFIVAICYFFKLKSKSNNFLLIIKATVILILFCGFTSYPFHTTSFLFLLFLCCSSAIVLNDSTKWDMENITLTTKRLGQAFLCVLLILSIIASYKSIRQNVYFYRWKSIRNRANTSSKMIKEEYLSLIPIFKYDGKFLTEYGKFLSADSINCSDAIKILESARQYYVSVVTVKSTSIAYNKLRLYSNAIAELEWLSCYLPNNFQTKFELLKLCQLNNDFKKGTEVGGIILSMPVKIPAKEIDRIRVETKMILADLNSTSR